MPGKTKKLSDVLRPLLSSLAAQRPLRKTIAGVLEAACETSGADASAVATLTSSGNLRILAVAGANLPERRILPLDSSWTGRVVRARDLVVAHDLRTEEPCPAIGPSTPVFRSVAGIPLESRNRALGTLVIARRRPGVWPRRIGSTLVPLARCASIALQQQQLRRYVRSHVFALLGGRRGDGDGRDRTWLSPREREIAELLVTGRSCKEIGIALDMSSRTVQHHVDRMKTRFGRNTLHGLTARLVDTLR